MLVYDIVFSQKTAEMCGLGRFLVLLVIKWLYGKNGGFLGCSWRAGDDEQKIKMIYKKFLKTI